MSNARDTRNRAFRGIPRPRQLAPHELAEILTEIDCPIQGSQIAQLQAAIDCAFMAAELAVSPTNEISLGEKGVQYRRIQELSRDLAEALTGDPQAAVNTDIPIAEWLWWGEGPDRDDFDAVRHSSRSGRLEDVLNGLRWLHTLVNQEGAGLPQAIKGKTRQKDQFSHELIKGFAIAWTIATGRKPSFVEPTYQEARRRSDFGTFVGAYLDRSGIPTSTSIPAIRAKFQAAMKDKSFRAQIEALERNAQTGAP